jgi:hypothetical protein
MLCGAGFAQDAGTAADSDKDAAPKARVLKGGALKDAAPDAADEKGGAPDGKQGDEAASTAAGKDTASAFKIEGDKVSLKSGKQLRGVKVLRVTPSMVELEYAPGQPVMKLPRRLVTNIEYENPANAPAAAAGAEEAGSGDVMVAEEISAEFNKKLTAPLPGAPLDFKDQDALIVLKDLADRAQVVLAVAPEAQQVPEAQRKITLSVPKDATLSTLLREGFRTAVPALKFSLQFDKVLVSSTEAEALKAAGPLPPGLAPKNGAAPK